LLLGKRASSVERSSATGKIGLLEEHALLTKLGQDPVGPGHTQSHRVVIRGHVLLEDRPLDTLRVMDPLEVIAPVELGQLLRVDRVVLVRVFGNQVVPAWLTPIFDTSKC
jgi:hypothetical protein